MNMACRVSMGLMGVALLTQCRNYPVEDKVVRAKFEEAFRRPGGITGAGLKRPCDCYGSVEGMEVTVRSMAEDLSGVAHLNYRCAGGIDPVPCSHDLDFRLVRVAPPTGHVSAMPPEKDPASYSLEGVRLHIP